MAYSGFVRIVIVKISIGLHVNNDTESIQSGIFEIVMYQKQKLLFFKTNTTEFWCLNSGVVLEKSL